MMKRTFLSTLLVAIVLGIACLCPAQAVAADMKTVVTVSFSGYDEVLSDVEYLGKLADNPNLKGMVEGPLMMMTQGEGLKGLDKSQPWGAIVQTDGQQFPVLVFVPVKDLGQLVGLLENLTGEAPEAEDGVYEIATDGPTVYVTEKSGWAFISNERDTLDDVPSDPTELLGELNEKYDLAVKASVQNVPEMFRQMFVAQLKMGAGAAMMQLPGEGDEDYAIRKGLATQGIDQLVTMINELDEVLLGFSIDQESGTSFLDIEITAVEGTDTAAQFAQLKEMQTNFAGFNLPEAAVVGNWASMLSDADVTQTKSTLATVRTRALKELENQGLSDDEVKIAQDLLGDLLDVIEKTIEGKKTDGGMALVLKPGAPTVVIGGTIAEGAKLEKVLKQVVDIAKGEIGELGNLIKLDAETHEGVTFHTITVPVPDEEAAAVLGQTVQVVIGLSEESFYLAAGGEAAAVLKQIIDASKADAGKQIAPMRISAALTPILKFAAEAADEDAKPMIAQFASILEQSEGKDHVTVVSKAIENGGQVRLELEEGVLKLIGTAIQNAGGGMF